MPSSFSQNQRLSSRLFPKVLELSHMHVHGRQLELNSVVETSVVDLVENSTSQEGSHKIEKIAPAQGIKYCYGISVVNCKCAMSVRKALGWNLLS